MAVEITADYKLTKDEDINKYRTNPGNIYYRLYQKSIDEFHNIYWTQIYSCFDSKIPEGLLMHYIWTHHENAIKRG